MDELAHKMVVARETLREATLPDAAWLERAAAEFKRRRQRHERLRRVRVASLGVAAALVVGITAIGVRLRLPAPSRLGGSVVAHAGAPAPVRLSDGSMAVPLDDLTVLRAEPSSISGAVVELVRGGARFRVETQPSRVLRIEAGPTVIDAPGSEFTVERIASQVRVAVYSGELQVVCHGNVVQLVEGETALFPRAPAWQLGDHESPTPSGEVTSDDRETASGAVARTANTSADRLLTAADAARRAHQPAYAVAPLRTLLATHPHDPRTAAAAFTLGRVWLDLGEYRNAALAFVKAASLDHGGSLAEDALAREVEAWSQAGDAARARDRASEYVQRYPEGARVDAMRKHAGLAGSH